MKTFKTLDEIKRIEEREERMKVIKRMTDKKDKYINDKKFIKKS